MPKNITKKPELVPPATANASSSPAQTTPPVDVDLNLPAPLPAPQVSPTVTLNLTEGDRWYAAMMFNEAFWGGGEAIVMAFGHIHATLRLADIDLGRMPNTLGRSAEKFELPLHECELLLAVMCGSGKKAIPGVVGPPFANLVVRIRHMITATVRQLAPAKTSPTPIQKAKKSKSG